MLMQITPVIYDCIKVTQNLVAYSNNYPKQVLMDAKTSGWNFKEKQDIYIVLKYFP